MGAVKEKLYFFKRKHKTYFVNKIDTEIQVHIFLL